MKYASTYALTIVTGLVILIVNSILRKTIDSLGKFNRYDTITKFISSMTTKLFLAFFFNTALITLFVKFHIIFWLFKFRIILLIFHLLLRFFNLFKSSFL